MKLRLVQDSYTKDYTIEYWRETTHYLPGGGEPETFGTWAAYGNPAFRMPNDPDYIKVVYPEHEQERAEKDFNHLVNKLSSKTIVCKEVEIN